MSRRRKSVSSAVWLCLLFGGVSGHQFYLGNTLLGVVYLLFFWTFVPVVISFFELFTLSGKVRNYNARQAMEVATKIKLGR